MANRQYLTPPDIPDDVYCRVLRIPNSPQWIGTLTGVLYPLCFPSAWTDEDGGITPDQAAERFTQIFNDMFAGSGECEDMACCPLRVNPYNGRLQQSNDGGLTWFDVADGPWIDSLYPPYSAMPQPRPEPTDDDKLCAAAATAAYVLRNLYTQTGDTLLNVVAATDWEYASALGSMLSGFLLMIGAVATQPYVAIATLLGIVGVRQQYVDYPLDDDDEERLTCILLENAELQPSGAVTFDFQATWDAIDLDSPKNGLMRFLLTMIGPDALNYAGAIDAGLTPDCSPCVTSWCYEWDFAIEHDGWYVTGTQDNNVRNSHWVTGVGLKSGGDLGINLNVGGAEFEFDTDTTITHVEWETLHFYGNFSAGNSQVRFYDSADQLITDLTYGSPGATNQIRTGLNIQGVRKVLVSVGGFPWVGADALGIKRVLLKGDGGLPFNGQSNC